MKKISLILCMALVIGTLSACNGEKKPAETTPVTTVVTTEATTEVTTEATTEATTEVTTEAAKTEATTEAPVETLADETTIAEAGVSAELSDMMAKLYEGVDEENLPKTMDTPITAEMSVFYTGVEASEYKEALGSDAMINAIAHSVCLIRAKSADEAEALAKLIEEKADPRKWICVEAEKKIVDYKDDIVILIMTNEIVAPQIHDNFLKIMGE